MSYVLKSKYQSLKRLELRVETDVEEPLTKQQTKGTSENEMDQCKFE